MHYYYVSYVASDAEGNSTFNSVSVTRPTPIRTLVDVQDITTDIKIRQRLTECVIITWHEMQARD